MAFQHNHEQTVPPFVRNVCQVRRSVHSWRQSPLLRARRATICMIAIARRDFASRKELVKAHSMHRSLLKIRRSLLMINASVAGDVIGVTHETGIYPTQAKLTTTALTTAECQSDLTHHTPLTYWSIGPSHTGSAGAVHGTVVVTSRPSDALTARLIRITFGTPSYTGFCTCGRPRQRMPYAHEHHWSRYFFWRTLGLWHNILCQPWLTCVATTSRMTDSVLLSRCTTMIQNFACARQF